MIQPKIFKSGTTQEITYDTKILILTFKFI